MRATDTGPQRLARPHRAGPQRNCDDHDWAHRISIRSPDNARTPQAKRIPNEPYVRGLKLWKATESYWQIGERLKIDQLLTDSSC